MYFDTPRDFIGGVYESLLYGDQPLGWDIIGRKETVRGATRETFLDYTSTWYRPNRMVVGVGGQLGDGLHDRLEELLGDLPAARDGDARSRAQPIAERARSSVHTKQSDQAHLVLGVRSRPLDRPRPLRAAAARDRARRRDVVAPLHRGARAARARLLRLRHEPRLHRRRLALRAVGRRHQPDRRRGDDDRRAVPAARVGAGAGRRAREGAQLRQGPLRAPAREPARDDHVRPAPRGARGPGARSRRPCSTRSTRSPPRTSSASRRRSSNDGPYLAVIGPFDDAGPVRSARSALVRAAERLPRLGDGLARVLDRGRVVRILLADRERALEGVERLLVLLGVEVLPAEVVEERPSPVGGRRRSAPPARARGSSRRRSRRGRAPRARPCARRRRRASPPRPRLRPRTRARRAAAPPPCRPTSGAAGRARGRRGCGRADRRSATSSSSRSPPS